MDGKHPCDICERQNKASGCSNCIFDNRYCITCGVSDCVYYHEGDCTLGFSDECKASDNYKDDLLNHDCSECVHCIEGECGLYLCDLNEEEIGEYDSACEDFEEGEQE